MARGWESKSVEDQIAEAEARQRPAHGRELTPDERERETKKMTLSLSRSRILQDLQLACDPRHRATLERALADVDAKIQDLP
jgi:hypothetical protein